MTDITALRAGLDTYAATLRRHFDALRERHSALEQTLAPLTDVYAGQGAERFFEVFKAADTQFKTYQEQGEVVLTMLLRKIDDLNRLDDPSRPDL